mgnify:CR=1 FL=1
MPTRAPIHRVQRLLVELTGARHADAAALQARVQQQLQQHLLPLIDRLCTQLADAGTVQRIHRLEIDLGTWPAAAWAGDGTEAQALHQRFEATLARQLGQALRDAPAVQTDEELVASVLHTGQLPWWADAADRGALQQALASVLARPVQHGQAWLPPADADAPALRRLVAALDDGQLAGLIGHLTTHQPTAPVPWARLLPAIAQTLGLPAPAWRHAWWCEALAAALQPGHSAPQAWARALQRLPGRLGQGAAVLAPAWRRALDHIAPDLDAAALAPLWQAVDAAWPAPGRPASALASPLDGNADPLATDPWADLSAALARRPAGDPARRWLPWLQALRQHLAPAALRTLADALASQRARPAGLAGAAALLQAGLAGVATPAGADAADRPAAAAALAAMLAPVSPGPAPRPATPASAPASLAAAEALPLANAGLVLLWPFIPALADRLGLLQDRQLRSPAHAQRLAALLQCMATGDADPPEFQLPLNKLLSGLPLDAPFLLDAPLTDAEQAECADLLQAVLQQAPVLGSISPDGLRQAFLQRSGQLGTQDGHWLLRVERATHDVLIDRLPWSPSIVRLPWMPRLLQVQW